MKKIFIWLGLFLTVGAILVFFSKRGNSNLIIIDDVTLKFSHSTNGEKGFFIFSLADFNKIDQVPSNGYLMAISSDGQVVISQKITDMLKPVMPVIFNKLDNNLFYYITSYLTGDMCCKSSLKFLSSDLKPFSGFVVPGAEEGLDYHSFHFSKRGTFFYQLNHYDDLSGKKDFSIEERDKNNKIIFKWNSRLLKEGLDGDSDNYDLNSIDIDEEHSSIYIGLRSSSKIIKISYPSGDIVWRLSRKNWKFVNDPYDGFLFQHSVKILSNGHILLFDNGNNYKNRPSRVVEYELDERNQSAKLVWQYEKKSEPDFSEYGGSVSRLANGNTLISWGNSLLHKKYAYKNYVIWTEVDATGNIVRELSSDKYILTYAPYFVKELPLAL